MDRRECRRCHVVYVGDEVEAMFWVDKSVLLATRTVCSGCMQSARDRQKRGDRWPSKCRFTIYRHAQKYIRLGLASTRDEFIERYGWDITAMAHDAEHAYGDECPYCHQKFTAMGNGLRDITLDVIDPTKPPYYRTNCRWVCSTCNTGKHSTPPHLFGARLAAYEKWRKWTSSEYAPDSLFGDWR
jgi:hypothetical protein